MTKAEIKALIARLTHENTTEREEAEILNAIVDAIPEGGGSVDPVIIDLTDYDFDSGDYINDRLPAGWKPSPRDIVLVKVSGNTVELYPAGSVYVSEENITANFGDFTTGGIAVQFGSDPGGFIASWYGTES